MNRNQVAASVAKSKERNPEKFCPVNRCLWRTGDGSRCPRHGGPGAAAYKAERDFVKAFTPNKFGEYA